MQAHGNLTRAAPLPEALQMSEALQTRRKKLSNRQPATLTSINRLWALPMETGRRGTAAAPGAALGAADEA